MIIAAIAFVLFGAKKLPELGRGLGEGLRGLKDGITGQRDDAHGAAESNANRLT